MGRRYTAVYEGQSVSAQVDVLEINCPTDAVVVIHRASLTDDTGEVSEQAAVTWIKGHTTSGSGGNAVTPAPIETGDPGFGGTVEAFNTTIASGGTQTKHGREGFNFVGQGYRYNPTPEERLVLSPGERLVLRLAAAPSSARTLSCEVVFEEIGG